MRQPKTKASPKRAPKKPAARRRSSVRPTRTARAMGKWWADMGDLMKLADTQHIGGLLQRKAVSVLHGDAGSLKTFTALAIGCCVGYGMPIMVNGPRCQRGLVLYVAYEDVRGFKARRMAWLRFHRLTSAHIDAVKVINPFEEDIGDLPGLDFDLLEPKKVQRLIDYAKSLAKSDRLPVMLLVIDVLREACGGIESTKTFRLAAAHSKRLANELNCHVMLLHHNTKSSERMRGPASLEGAIQQRFLLRRHGAHIEIAVAKNREGPTGVHLAARAHEMVMGLRPNRPPVKSLAIELQTMESGELLEANEEKVLQLCNVMDADTSMSEGKLLKLTGMSVTGSGGMQRQMLRKWVPAHPKSITVHNGGTDYRRFFRELVRKRWLYYCQAVDPAEAKTEMLEAKQPPKPKVEPEVARVFKQRQRKGGK